MTDINVFHKADDEKHKLDVFIANLPHPWNLQEIYVPVHALDDEEEEDDEEPSVEENLESDEESSIDQLALLLDYEPSSDPSSGELYSTDTNNDSTRNKDEDEIEEIPEVIEQSALDDYQPLPNQEEVSIIDLTGMDTEEEKEEEQKDDEYKTKDEAEEETQGEEKYEAEEHNEDQFSLATQNISIASYEAEDEDTITVANTSFVGEVLALLKIKHGDSKNTY